MINDYELIYLVQNHRDEIALKRLLEKYKRFIWKYIHKFYTEIKDQDDFFQEACMLLYHAVKFFDESKNKTFTRYFELILIRLFVKMREKISKYVLYDNTDFIKGCSYIIEEEKEVYLLNIDLKSDIEQKVNDLYFVRNFKIKEIATMINYSEKQIYNAIFRIKEKYKMTL